MVDKSKTQEFFFHAMPLAVYFRRLVKALEDVIICLDGTHLGLPRRFQPVHLGDGYCAFTRSINEGRKFRGEYICPLSPHLDQSIKFNPAGYRCLAPEQLRRHATYTSYG